MESYLAEMDALLALAQGRTMERFLAHAILRS